MLSSRLGVFRASVSSALCILVLATVGLLLFSTASRAQGGEGFVNFQLSFSNPGARSLGFGGAFVALADDATAAYANPAGLVQLIQPEVSVEGRFWSYSTAFTLGGRIDGEPTGIGIDSALGLRTARSSDDIADLSFVSFVYPGKRWSLALYRHQLANFEFFSQTDALFRESAPPDPPGLTTSRSLDVRASTDSEIVGWGISGAYRLSDDLSLGLGVIYREADVSSTVEAFFPDSQQRFFEENSYLAERMAIATSLSIDGSDLGLTGGVLWRVSERWKVGGLFRQGPRLRIGIETRAGPGEFFDVPTGTLVAAVSSPMDLPDVYGVGVAYQSADGRFAASFEWDRVEYATILDSLQFDTGMGLDDGDELHIGAEYVFLEAHPVTALRLGAWLDPEHRASSTTDDPVDRALFRPGDDELHLAVGLGLALPALQLDFAADFSDPVDTLSLSTIYSF
jgi:hypothetical protein